MLSNRVVVLAVAIACSGIGLGARAVASGQPSGGQRDPVRDALRQGGIPAAAALVGHYEGTVSANPENNVDTLEHLVAWHSLIVIGRIESNHSWSTADALSTWIR